MKSNKVLGFLMFTSVGLVVACGGVSAIGSGDDPNKGGTMTTGGTEPGVGGTSTKGGTDPGMGGTTAKGGTDPGMGGTITKGGTDPGMGGVGAGPGTGLCMADQDCAGFDAPCQMCPGGSVACQKTYCDSGKCVTVGDTCSAECSTDKDCAVPDGCLDCGGGALECPSAQCLMGKCQVSYPSCPNVDPCKGQACGTPCKPCDGTGMCNAMEPAYCDGGGKCVAGLPTCTDPGMCKTAMDCGSPPPKCVPCGNDTCATFDCIQGSCVFACPANPTPQCMTSEDCTPLDSCKMCPGNQCAVEACIKGSCEPVCPL